MLLLLRQKMEQHLIQRARPGKRVSQLIPRLKCCDVCVLHREQLAWLLLATPAGLSGHSGSLHGPRKPSYGRGTWTLFHPRHRQQDRCLRQPQSHCWKGDKTMGEHAAAPIPSRVCGGSKTLFDWQKRTLREWGVLAAGARKRSLFSTA